MSKNNDFVSAANANNDEFISSLDSLTTDDVVPPHRKKLPKANLSFFNISRILITLLCVIVFVYCIYELSGIIKDYQRGDDIYTDLSNEYQTLINGITSSNVTKMTLSKSDVPMSNYSYNLENGSPIYTPGEDGIDKGTTSLKFQVLLAYIEGLREQNPDIYGYINIPNSKISYPMVQCEDNEFYLTHSWDRRSLAVGSIFIDFRNRRQIENNKNIIIYGHNMMNGSMFCDATKYLEEDFFMNLENDIEITTFDGLYTFRVFSAYPTSKYDDYFRTYFATDEDFVNFCYEREARSLFHREDISFSPDDVLITLSTCILGNEDGRYAVHAKLIKVEN